MFSRSWHAIGLQFLLSDVTVAQNTARQTLYLEDQFLPMKPCAARCIAYSTGGCGVDKLANVLGCPYAYCEKETGAPNDCYCRGDNQAPANSYLSSCIKSACTVGDVSIDIASAVGLYNGYCTSNGLLAAAVTTAPPTTVMPTTGSANVNGPTVYVTVYLPHADIGHSKTAVKGTRLVELVLSIWVFLASLWLQGLEKYANADTTFYRVSSSSASISTSGSKESASSNSFPTTTPPDFPTASSQSGAAATAFVVKSGNGKEGLSTSDKIALGVGLGVGLLAVIVAIPGCYIALRRGSLARSVGVQRRIIGF
ncbi:hypothetical protein DL98DRAFT_583813 [Cadophora sp. DSE1049]|nr:hypothetical protein DL98DRAFT_583813 [Cadophora sp. DSE1049]